MGFLPDDYLIIMGRLLMAAFVSGLIGIERETKQQPAGLRTHLLVGTGSCLMMIMAVTGFDSFLHSDIDAIRYDPARIASYVISGIGFLGAGTIIVQRGSVKGLTTAASIWVAAGLGLTIGLGMYFAAILTTLIVLTTLYILQKLEMKYLKGHAAKTIVIIAEDRPGSFASIQELFGTYGVAISDFQIEHIEEYGDRHLSRYSFSLQNNTVENEIELVKHLQRHEAVYKVLI